MNLSVGLLGKNHIASSGCRVVAARHTLRDRHADGLVCQFEELGPLPYAGTSARRSVRLRLNSAVELMNIKRKVIDEFTLPHSNFEGRKCKGGMGRGRLPIAEVAA